jgi:hypothetical protein
MNFCVRDGAVRSRAFPVPRERRRGLPRKGGFRPALPSAYTARIQHSLIPADTADMTSAVVAVSRDTKSFRLAKPVGAELTVCTFLSLAASGLWLLVLPLELLRLVA